MLGSVPSVLLLVLTTAVLVVLQLLWRPRPPKVRIVDVRANRIRLGIKPAFLLPFDLMKSEVHWRPAAGTAPWTSTGKSDLEQRTVARLAAGTNYQFRVRTVTPLGVSRWCGVLESQTKLEPVNGGSKGPGFEWQQTPSDVTITFQVPLGVSKRDVKLELKTQWIRVAVAMPGATDKQVLLEGELYGKVKSFNNGSVWEMVRERDHVALSLTLEKRDVSVAPKFDYWRAVIPGQHEIDTHKIVSEDADAGLKMLKPGDYTQGQLENMRLRGMG